MPPSPNNVDGIKPPAPAPTGPPQRPVDQPQPQAASEQPAANQHSNVDLKAEAAKAAKQPEMLKSSNKGQKKDGAPVTVILFTLIVMVALIGLAYFAYSSSK